MTPNPPLGVLLHAIGGFAAGSFYAPLKRVKRWAWESYWLVMGLAAWLVTPWVVAAITTPDLMGVLRASPSGALGYAYLFGVLWGIGSVTFGLTMRYLGMALGMAVALGFTMTVGTLVPPVFTGLTGGPEELQVLRDLFVTTSGQTVLAGIAVGLLGVAVCGYAGLRREAEQKPDAAEASELAFGKGIVVAVVAGVLSACFAFALAAGQPIADASIARGTASIFSNNAVLVVILTGGLTTNGLWCLWLNARNRTFGDYVTGPAKGQLLNYALSALGGFVWYNQFFFYGMGTTRLGEKYDFSSWSLHMSFIIVFSNLWGLYFREWRGVSGRTKAAVWSGIAILIAATIIIGWGNAMAVAAG